jgi:GxxExxY protein
MTGGKRRDTEDFLFLLSQRLCARKLLMTENEIGTILVGTAIDVHRELGPGLLESVYEVVLEHELKQRGLTVKSQVPISIVYKGIAFAEAFRADLLVADKVIVELKSVEQISKAHRKQIQTYLRLTGLKLGYIFNFGAGLMKEGIVRAVNGLEEVTRTEMPRREEEE